MFVIKIVLLGEVSCVHIDNAYASVAACFYDVLKGVYADGIGFIALLIVICFGCAGDDEYQSKCGRDGNICGALAFQNRAQDYVEEERSSDHTRNGTAEGKPSVSDEKKYCGRRDRKGERHDDSYPRVYLRKLIAFCRLFHKKNKRCAEHYRRSEIKIIMLGEYQPDSAPKSLDKRQKAAFDERRCVARDERDEPADYIVGLICFMFELVYPASRALAREQGDIYRLLDAPFGITRPFTDPATQATWSRLKDETRGWLARV